MSGYFPQVSWIRKRDLHILTAGIYTYTSDARFQVRQKFVITRGGGGGGSSQLLQRKALFE
jgi:hypothetical protein